MTFWACGGSIAICIGIVLSILVHLGFLGLIVGGIAMINHSFYLEYTDYE